MSIRTDMERELARIQAVSGRGLLQIDCSGGRVEADWSPWTRLDAPFKLWLIRQTNSQQRRSMS